jgi:dihydroneopterin aldolase
MVDRIILKGIRVSGRHGVSAEERADAQEFEIDLACSTDATAAARSNELSATVDYARLSRIAVSVATGGSYRLLETLAERIAQAILSELRPSWLRVRVTKLAPEGVGGPASVEIERGSWAIASSAPIELHVSDFAPAKRFYGALGFDIARERRSRDDGYLVMVHGADVLRFWPGNVSMLSRGHFGRDPAPSRPGHGVEIVLTFDDLDSTFVRAQAVGTIVAPIRLRHWGLRDFRVLDPYGFYIRCTEQHDPLGGAPRPEH